jgi:1-acyl-sn-glycerol-3-phosphate acyltransferase
VGAVRGVDTALRTAVGLVVLPTVVVVYSLAVMGLALAGASTAAQHWFFLSFARICLRVAGTDLQVRGQEHVVEGRPCIVVANHVSDWDPPCILAALPRLCIRFVAKQQIMSIPVFGHALRLSGNLRVVRTETAGDVERIREGMGRRAPNVSMLFFAEGTRSPDGRLGPFKMGAFAAALAFGLPILPVGHAGTYAIWPKQRLRLRRGVVAVEIGEPISTEGLGFEDRAALRDRTREAVAELRARARRRLREQGSDPGGLD